MKILLCICLLTLCTSCSVKERPQITGSTHYHNSDAESLKTTLSLDQKHYIHKPSHQRYAIVAGSKLVVDIDHFGNEININPCTTIGIEF